MTGQRNRILGVGPAPQKFWFGQETATQNFKKHIPFLCKNVKPRVSKFDGLTHQNQLHFN